MSTFIFCDSVASYLSLHAVCRFVNFDVTEFGWNRMSRTSGSWSRTSSTPPIILDNWDFSSNGLLFYGHNCGLGWHNKLFVGRQIHNESRWASKFEKSAFCRRNVVVVTSDQKVTAHPKLPPHLTHKQRMYVCTCLHLMLSRLRRLHKKLNHEQRHRYEKRSFRGRGRSTTNSAGPFR